MIFQQYFQWEAMRALERHAAWLSHNYPPAVVRIMMDHAVWNTIRP